MNENMSTCMDCANWNPKGTDPGIARLGFAACLKRTIPGHTFSAHAKQCEKFAPADNETTAARHTKWDDKGARRAKD